MKTLALKLSFLLTALVLSYGSIHAQEKSKERVSEQQIGINITDFVDSFAAFNDNTIESGPYHFIYKRLKNGRGLRVLTGFAGSQSEDFFAEGTRTILQFNINTKIGYEWNRNIIGKWDVQYGVDLINNYLESTVTTNTSLETVRNIDQRYRVALNPFLGLSFRINPKLQLMTMAGIDLGATFRVDANEFDQFPEFNTKDFFTAFEGSTQLPTALYLIFNW